MNSNTTTALRNRLANITKKQNREFDLSPRPAGQEIAEQAMDALEARDREIVAARGSAEYWKAEHLAGNALIESLRAQLQDATAKIADAKSYLGICDWSCDKYGKNKMKNTGSVAAKKKPSLAETVYARDREIAEQNLLIESLHSDLYDARMKVAHHGEFAERIISWLDAERDESEDFTTLRNIAKAAIAAQSPSDARAVAYLHDVVHGDGEHDQALSFKPDSFPLEGVGGFRSIGCTPLYAAAEAHNESPTSDEEFEVWLSDARAIVTDEQVERACAAAALSVDENYQWSEYLESEKPDGRKAIRAALEAAQQAAP